MNTTNKHSIITSIKSKLLIRLWLANMLLVVIGIVFLWTVQILLFEPNYTNATKERLLQTVQENARELETVPSISADDSNNPLRFLSKTIVGMLFLVDENGEVLYVYNNGQDIPFADLEVNYSWLLNQSSSVIAGETINEVEDFSKSSAIVIGVPTTYQEKPVAILLYNTITQIDALQALNRQQLLLFSVILTLFASIISFLLARHFSKPINTIKDAVTRLTNGDLHSVAKMNRSDELGKLSDSVVALSIELQRLDVLRKELIANVSHELRSPLALITGYGEMVRDVTGNNEQLRKENMDLIISEANRMSAMVDDIMDFSIMQAGYTELKLEQNNLFAVVESVVQYGRGIADQFDIAITFEAYSNEILCHIDRIKIDQVLRNLVNNAVNHTLPKETIYFKLTKVPNGSKVSIINPGYNIPQEELEQIWERYQRVQHQGCHKEGTGIGLAIVKTILISHNFDYGVQSEDGLTCFWFIVPRYSTENENE